MIELEGLKPHEVAQLIPSLPVLVAYRGSHSHGTYIPPEDPDGVDDVDILTCFVPPIEDYFGAEGQVWRGKDTKVGKWDAVSYEYRHLAKLLTMANPNVLSVLWLKPEDYIHLEEEGRALIESRMLFSSKLAHKSFGGYAYSQLKRMTAWHGEQSAPCGCEGEFHSEDCKLRLERGRGSSKLYATGFMGAKRKDLVLKYGYDVKNAAHLIRLLRMGREFLLSGMLRVDRTHIDAEELKLIKRGGRSLAYIQAEAKALYASMDEALAKSPLPETPDFQKINALVTSVLCFSKTAEVSLRANYLLRNVAASPNEGPRLHWSRALNEPPPLASDLVFKQGSR